MIKSLLLFLSLASAQTVTMDTARMNPGTLPATCRNGDLKIDANDGYALKSCVANTWGPVGTALPTFTTDQILFGDGSNIPNSEAAFTYDDSTNTLAVDNIDLGGGSITNVVDPTDPQDVATKSYVDNSTDPNMVVGPASATDNAVAIFDTGTGKLLKNSGLIYSAPSTLTATLSGNASTATALAANPADCSASQFATTIAANGNLTCAQPLFTDVSGTLAINKGGTGQTTANAALNALLPTQTANTNKVLTTNGTDSSWQLAAGGGFFNLLNAVNWNFEGTPATDAWTASGGTFAAATSTNILDGLQSVTWDSGSASQTLSSTSVTIPNGMFGRNGWAQCKTQVPSGTATHKIQVYDGTNVISEQDITSSTAPIFNGTSFIYPSSGSLSLRLLSVNANEPLVAIDSCTIGDAIEMGKIGQISPARKLGSVTTPVTASCAWGSITNASFASFSADADCPVATVTGSVSAPGTKIPAVTITNGGPGTYYFVATGALDITGGNQSRRGYRFYDGTNAFGATHSNAVHQSVGNLIGSVDYITGFTSKTIEVQGQATSTDSATINVAFADYPFVIEVYYFPNSAQQAATYDTAKWQIDANISGAHISLGTSAQTAYITPNNSGLTLTQNTGSDSVGISCSSTNDNTVGSTTCSAGSEEPGVVFNLPRAGTIELCYAFAHQFVLATGGVDVTFQAVTTANGSQTIDLQGKDRLQSGGSFGSVTVAHPMQVCGTFAFTSAGKKTSRLMYEQSVGGTITTNQILDDAGASNGQRDIHVTARYIDQAIPAMTIKNSIVTPSSGVVNIVSALVTDGSSTTTVSQETGDWINGNCTNGSAGNYTCTLVTGTFSGTPNCWASLLTTAGANRFISVQSVSASSVSVHTANGAGSDTDNDFNLFCMGPK